MNGEFTGHARPHPHSAHDGMVLKLPTNSMLLNKLYANNGVRVRMQVRKQKPHKIPTVKDLLYQIQRKHEILFQEEMEALECSSSTPTVPYSTADVLYGNEVSRSPQLEEGRQNSFIDFTGKEQRTSSRELGDLNPRRPSSKAGSKKSFSIEKVNSARESEDNLRPSVLPNPKTVNQYRPNGVRNSFLKSEPLFSSRSNAVNSGRDADDLIAMGTIWSPNAHSSLKQLNNNTSSANSLTNNSIPNVSGKNIQMQTTQGSNSSTGIGQTTRGRYNGTGMRPIMVQPTRNNVIKEVDPKYTDPVIGAPASFQQRLMELSALEAETIRYERNKKVKKKVKQDRDS